MDVTDKYANMANKKRTLNMSTGTANMGDFHILSIPAVSLASGAIDFYVGKNLNNSILYYIKYDNSRGQCYVDTDLGVDSDGDGVKDNDKDFYCNQLYLQKYEPKYQSALGRIYYTNPANTLVSKDFNVSFLDFQTNLTPEMTAIYKEIQDVISSLAVGTTGTINDFRTLLVSLRDGLIDENDTKSNVVSVKNFYDAKAIQLPDTQKNLLQDVFTRLTDSSVAAAA